MSAVFFALLCLLELAPVGEAQFRWVGTTNEWNSATNWSPTGIPGSAAEALFGIAPITTEITFTGSASIGELNFSAGSPSYSFVVSTHHNLTINGIGGDSIVSNSSNPVIFYNGGAHFDGGNLIFDGGTIVSNSTGMITINSAEFGTTIFNNSSSAGDAIINNTVIAVTRFNNSSTAGNAVISNSLGSDTYFYNQSTGGNAGITNNNATTTQFINTSTAGNATITNNSGGGTLFQNASTAGNSIIINDGGDTQFFTTSTAGNATITTNSGGSVYFNNASTGGAARFITNLGGTFDISQLASTGMTAGSIEGAGTYMLGSKTLTIGSNGINTTVSGIISDGGLSGGTGASLIKVGTGTLTLTGPNTYSGGTTIDAGTLELSGFTPAGSGPVTVNAAGTLLINSGVEPVRIGPLSGSGTVNLLADNGLAVNLASGVSTTFSGTLEGSPPSNISGVPLFILNGSGTLHLDGTTTLLGVIVVNGGTLDLDSSTALSNNTLITVGAGAQIVVNDVNLPTAGLTNYSAGAAGSIVLNGGSLTVEPSAAAKGANLDFAGNISGTGGFEIDAPGISQTLSGNNSYSGPTTITAGTLIAGSTTAFSPNSAFTVNGIVNLNGFSNTIASLSGTGGVAILSGGSATLTVGDADSTTFSGVFTDVASTSGGALSLIKVGTGTLTLSGANAYSGSTTVDAGVLNFTGTLTNASTRSSSVTVNSGGTLTGNGTIKEPVIVSSGGILAPGVLFPVTIGTLTVGSLTLNSGSTLNYELGQPNVVGGTTNDLIQVNGNLTLSGATLNIANIGGFGEGVYRIFNYTGSVSLSNNGLIFGTLPTGITASELLLQTSQAGQINVLVSASGFTDQFWDGTTTVADGTIHGGSGTWNNVTTNWTNLDATVNAPWNNGFAIFSGTAGTVTLGDNIQFNGAEFMTTGYTVSAPGAQTLMATAGTVIRVDPNVTATIAAPIVDASGVHADVMKTDAGTLILTATNTYSGGTTISDGALQLGNGGTSGSIVGNVVDNGIFAIDRSDAFTFGGNISGTGAFEQLGTGTTTLTGTNTYSGTTMVSSGILQAGSVDVFSPNSQFVVNSGATLDLNGFSNTIASLTGNGSVINSAKLTLVALTLGGDSTDDIFSGVIGQTGGGTLSLVKVGLGTEVFTGTNLYTGGTTISGGTLQLGEGGTTGSIVGKVADNAVFAIDRSDTYIFNGAISGTGSFKQLGKGTTIFTGNDTYTGGTTISAGTLQIGDGGAIGSIVGKVTDDGILAFDRSDAYTFNGTVKGRGSVEQLGGGTLTLSGANNYSGGTELDAGTLIVDNASALGTGDVTVSGGILTADPQPINVQGNYFQGPNGTLQLTIAGANPGQYDFLNVTGNATLGGTLKLINQNFTPQVGDTLTLVKVGGAIANKFATVIDPFTTRPGLNTIDLVYSLHTVDLEFLNIVPPTSPTPPPPRITTINFPSFAQNPNEVAAGELLNAVELNPRFANVLNFFLAQPFANIPSELAVIGPQSFTSFYEISFSDANIQRLTLESRLDDIRASEGSLNVSPIEGGTVGLQQSSSDGKTAKNPVEPVLQPARHPVFDLWASGFGDFVHVDSDYNARGYRFTTSGFDLGFDYRFLDHFAVGVMGNYTYTWTDLRPGTITVNSGRGGLYAGYFTGGYYLNAGVYGGYNTYDTSRHGLAGIATGNTDGQEWSGFISTGYDFHRGDLTVGPIASLQYTNVYINSFSETGSLVPLNIHSDSEESLRSDVGFRAEYQWHAGNVVVAPYLKATWEHEFKYSALPVTAGLAGFPGPNETFYGPAEGQDSAILSAGVSVQWTPAVSSYVGYDGQLGRGRYNSNAVRGGIRVSW